MSTALTLGQRMVRTAGIFQAIVALPVMLTLGAQVFDHLWYYYYNPNIYQFIRSAFNALFAAFILFILLIQRQQIPLSKRTNFYLEVAKSAFATAVWMWLVADSIFIVRRDYRGNPYPGRGMGIVRNVLSGVALIFVFYPTLGFAWFDLHRKEENVEDVEEGQAVESTPLLRE